MSTTNEQKNISDVIAPIEEAVVHLFQKIVKSTTTPDVLFQNYQQALSMLSEFRDELRVNPLGFSSAEIEILQSKASKLAKNLDVINLLLDTLSKDPTLGRNIAAFYQKDFAIDAMSPLAGKTQQETVKEEVIAEITPKKTSFGLFRKISA